MLSERWLLGLTILLAFSLRVYRLASQSIWYDEGLSIYYARRPLPELLALVSGSDHPPLYFLLLHGWLRLAAFGHPAVEFLVRYPSVILGVLLIPLAYAFGHRLLGTRAGLTAAVLVASSPFHVWYSQETRMYTLVTLLTLWASHALWSNLQPGVSAQGRSPTCRTQPSGPGFGDSTWAAYSLTTALALYAHFYAVLILLAHATFVTCWAWRCGQWRTWRQWTGAVSVAVVIFLPWGGLVAGQLQANDTYWRGTLDLGRTISETAQAFTAGQTIQGFPATLATAAYLLLAGAALYATWESHPSKGYAAAFLLAYVFVPLTSLLAISYNRPKFAPRYLLTVTPALTVLTGWGAAALWEQASRSHWRSLRYAPVAAMGIILGVSGVSLQRHYTDEHLFKADWRAVAQYIDQHATPRDAVVIVAGHAMPAYDFYNTRRLDMYPVPPRLLPTVSDPVESGDVVATLNRLRQAGHDRTWLILWQERLSDPRRLTLNLLFEHGRRLGVNEHFHGLNLLLFELPASTVFEPPRPEHPLDVVFGGQLRLEGYDLSSTSVAAGDTITLRLHWRAVRPVRQDYTAFTQLLSPTDVIVGQHDRRLGGDEYPTSRWSVGEPVRETYELTVRPDTPAGRYRLIAGVYLPASGTRLPVIRPAPSLAEGNSGLSDHVVIAEVEVRPGDQLDNLTITDHSAKLATGNEQAPD